MPEKNAPTPNDQAIETPGKNGPGGDEGPRLCSNKPTIEAEADEETRIVKEWHVKEDLVDYAELIRSIQRTEGNPDCFKKKSSCEETDCAWRSYCLPQP
jgi:hypothetical protein